MPIKNILAYICLFCVCSCQQEQTMEYQKMILGEWRPVSVKNNMRINYIHGYNFMEDGLCDNNLGFFSYFHSKGELLHVSEASCISSMRLRYPFFRATALNNVLHSYGNRTYYNIVEDTLKIYDPSKNSWINQLIRFESPDIMILSFMNECEEVVDLSFARVSYESEDKPVIEQLLFYYPYGVQPPRVFSIQRDGTFISYGYKGEGELFVGKMKDGEFERIESLFKRFDLNNIECGGGLFSWFDPQIAVIYKNEMKIISAMTVAKSNKEFYWAYISTLFCPENIYIQPVDIEGYIKTDFLNIQSKMISYCHFISNNAKVSFGLIESFHFNQLLITAKETTQDFEPIYRLTLYSSKQQDQMDTDGQYYRFTDDDGKTITLDIGVNILDIKREYINTYEQCGADYD